MCRGGGYETYLAPLGQYLMKFKIVHWGHVNARNIVCKNKHILVMCNCMVSMATHYVILKNGVYLQKYSYLSSNSYENNKLCTEVTRTHISLIINLHIHEYKCKLKKLKNRIKTKGVYQQNFLYLSCKVGTKLML